MASLFINYLRRQIDSRPSDFEIQYIKPIKTAPPAHASSAVFCLLALLVVPSFAVVSWVLENTFFSTTAFSWKAFGDLVLPLGAGIFAAAVSSSRNPMHSLLSLLGVFFCTALLYLIAGIAFVGVVFLIVYVGAVAVLFLFVIMLLNVKSLTSDEPLIRHVSQVLAIAAVVLLLLQIHFILIGSIDHAFAIGFLREAIIEPSTGEAVSFFVRFLAMDINGLIGLYTTHGILLMVITAILLAALLGAIILATVTTERATSISDLRRYSKEVAPVAAAVTLSFFIFAAPTEGIDAVLTLISPSEIDPIFLSFYYEKAERDRELRTIRSLKQDTYVAHNFQFSTRHRPLRRFLKARFAYRRKQLRKSFDTDNENFYDQRYPQIYNRELTDKEMQHLDYSGAVSAVYVAQAALAPVLARRYRGLSAVRIMRRRWLWRWRRNRAAWLRRLTLKDSKIPQNVEEEEKEKYYPRFPTTKAGAEVEYKYTFFRRVIVRLRPALRLFGKGRISFSTFLHLMLVTKFYAWIFYWAWRIRTFCAYFICFVFLLPFVTAAVWLFIEEQVVVAETLADIHKLTAELLYEYSDLKHLSKDFSSVAATLIIVPATAYATAVAHPWLLVGSALAFAWNAMTSHGGELSDAEFQESRCNYWRKHADDHIARAIDWSETTFLERTGAHPDKGRTDFFVVIGAIDWVVKIYTFLVAVLSTLFDLLKTILQSLFDLLAFLIKTIAESTPFRCAFGTLEAIWDVLKGVPSHLVKEFPILADVYAIMSEHLLTAQAALGRLYETTLAALRQLCELIWLYACRGFYAIEYRPRFLDALNYKILAPIPYSIITLFVIIAVVLYFIATLVVLVPWRRVYQGVNVRRPSAALYAGLFLVALYVAAVLAQKFPPLLYWHFYPLEFISDDFYIFHKRFVSYGYPTLIEMYPYYFLAVVGLAGNFLYRIVQRKLNRDRTLSGQALVFRNYYNYWLRCMGRHEASFRKELTEELAPFSSTQEAYTTISQEAKAEAKADNVAEIAHARRMIWVRVKYVPKYYDPHPDVTYRKHRWAYAYVVENHYKNPHHSA